MEAGAAGIDVVRAARDGDTGEIARLLDKVRSQLLLVAAYSASDDP